MQNKTDRLLSFISIGMKAGAYTLGSDMTKTASRSGKIKLILLSTDASENTKKLISNISKSKNIQVIEPYDMYELGFACGKPHLSVVGVKNEKIAEQIKNLYGQSVKRGNA